MIDQRSSLVDTAPAAAGPVAPGGMIGRYFVLAPLGSGGMGIVFSAYDPALDRKVAIKLLRGDRLFDEATGERSHLVAEAQTMARLSHPNVVAVHEIGFTDGAAYLVMDHITGPTLRGWLAERARSWREVLAMYRGAGEGLAAAHREAIVHRDFKPENALVDPDGRARVVDFGIAATIKDNAAASGVGTPVGTPVYMAPEQLRGEPCDARADQFAYCVALWEALHGSRPFAGTTAAELQAAIAAGQIADPGRKTPEWVRAALRRGLEAAPDARWPSLEALLRVLARDPRVMRRRIAGATALVALAAAGVWTVWPSAEIDPCPSAATRLAGAWDAPRKAAVQAAFTATHLAYADATWHEVNRRIDSYTAGWVNTVGEACRATRVEGRQSDTLLDLRMDCLDRRRSALASLTELWARGVDGDTLEHAISAAGALAPLADCADVRALTDRVPRPTDPAHAAMAAAVRPKLDAVLALNLAHRWLDAKQAATMVRTEADATGWPALRAEAALAQGLALYRLTDANAEAALLDAVRLAGIARDDRIAARALTHLVELSAEAKQSADRALQLAEIADGAVARAGNDDRARALLLNARGSALLVGARYPEARAAFSEARTLSGNALGGDSPESLLYVGELARVALAEGDYPTAQQLGRYLLPKIIAAMGPDHPRVAAILNNLGLACDTAEDLDAAADYYQQALDLKMKIFGPETAGVAVTMHNLAGVENKRHHLDVAERLYKRALEIRLRVLGPEHGTVAITLAGIADVRRQQGAFAEASQLLTRALEIKTKVYGAGHPSVAHTLIAMADLAAAQGDQVRALELQQRALEIRRKAIGPDSPLTFLSMINVARLLAVLHRCGEARPLLALAMPGLQKAHGVDHSDYAAGLAATAECDLGSGTAARAVDDSGRAIAIFEKLHEPPSNRGSLRWLHARALWAAGRHGDAIAAANTAEQELGSDTDGAIERTAAHAWLATHAR